MQQEYQDFKKTLTRHEKNTHVFLVLFLISLCANVFLLLFLLDGEIHLGTIGRWIALSFLLGLIASIAASFLVARLLKPGEQVDLLVGNRENSNKLRTIYNKLNEWHPTVNSALSLVSVIAEAEKIANNTKVNSVKAITGSFVSQTIRRVFPRNPIEVVVFHVRAGEYAEIIQECIENCSRSISFTSLFSPVVWFNELLFSNETELLKIFKLGNKIISRGKGECSCDCKKSLFESTRNEYFSSCQDNDNFPKHEKAMIATKLDKKRVFILTDESWSALICPANRAFFEVLWAMAYEEEKNCLNSCDTRFIKLTSLSQSMGVNNTQGDHKDSGFYKDFGLYDNQVYITWTAKPDTGNIGNLHLRFINGSSYETYEKVFDFTGAGYFLSFQDVCKEIIALESNAVCSDCSLYQSIKRGSDLPGDGLKLTNLTCNKFSSDIDAVDYIQ